MNWNTIDLMARQRHPERRGRGWFSSNEQSMSSDIRHQTGSTLDMSISIYAQQFQGCSFCWQDIWEAIYTPLGTLPLRVLVLKLRRLEMNLAIPLFLWTSIPRLHEVCRMFVGQGIVGLVAEDEAGLWFSGGCVISSISKPVMDITAWKHQIVARS